VEWAYKPSSVESVHLSGTAVAHSLVRPTRGSCGVGLTPVSRRRLALYLALLRAGFGQPACLHTAGALLPHHFTLAHREVGGMFLCHFPSGRPAWVLPSALPCGARTFLSRRKRRPRTLGPLRVYCTTGPLIGTGTTAGARMTRPTAPARASAWAFRFSGRTAPAGAVA